MSENQSKSTNEIDLLDLFSSVWKGIRNFFKAIIDTILFLILFGLRNIHWLLMIAIISALVGYIKSKTTDNVYSSEMIAQPNGFTSVDMVQYINDVHNMCKRGNFRGIANAFNISEEDAKHILNIEAFHFIDVNRDNIGDQVDYKKNFNPLDSTKSIVMNRILIQAEVAGNNDFTEVKKGLINFIDKNPYLLTVNALRKEELKTLIDRTDAEISKLDSLQDFEYYKNIEDGRFNREGQIVFLNEKTTQLYYLDKVSLLNARIGYQKSLELASDPITIIKDFAALQMEENPVTKYIIIYGFFGGLFGYIILMFLVYRKKVINYLATKL